MRSEAPIPKRPKEVAELIRTLDPDTPYKEFEAGPSSITSMNLSERFAAMRTPEQLLQAEASFLKALLNYDRARWTSTTLASLGIVISLVILGWAVKTEIDGQRNHPIVIAGEP